MIKLFKIVIIAIIIIWVAFIAFGIHIAMITDYENKDTIEINQ